MAFPDFAILAAVAFIVNFSGAVGDLWLLTMIWRFRRCSDLALVDTMTGMLIHTPDPAAATIVSRLQSPSRVVFFERLYRFVLVWGIAALVGLVIATIGVAVLLDWLVESDFKSLVIGPDSFPLLSFSQTPTELSFLLDYRFLAFVTMVFPLLDLWGQVRWGSPAPKSRPRHDGVPRPAVL
jgi:hypothetical protein